MRRLGSFRIIGGGKAGERATVRGIGFVSRNWLLAFGCWLLAGWNWVRFAEIGGGGTLGMRELGSFCAFGVASGMKLGSFRIFGSADGGRGANWVRFAFFGSWGYPAGGTGGLNLWRHALRAILFLWAWFVTPPVFGVALSLIMPCIIPESLVDVQY